MTPVDEASSKLRDGITSLCEMVPAGATVLLAVSGGSDSSGLVQVAAACAVKQDILPIVGFVDHGLRSGTEAEWTHVKNNAYVAGMKALRKIVSAKDAALATDFKGGVQEWARERRYALLLEMAREVGAAFIATAHTINDQAETVILRMMRGTGLDGLGGILPRRMWENVEIIRPMLGLEREVIREALREVRLGWIEDPSNENLRFARVKVRNQLLPLMESIQPKIGQKLAALAEEARETVTFVQGVVDDKKEIVRLRLGGGVKVDSSVFSRFPESLRGRLVRSAIKQVQGDLRRLEREHLRMILRLLAENKNTLELPVPGDTVVQTYRGSLYVFPNALPKKPTGSGHSIANESGIWRLDFPELGVSADVGSDDSRLIEQLELRARCDGDRLLGSETKFKEILSEGKIPWSYRDFVPVLAIKDRVIACPSLLESRNPELTVGWVFDKEAPFLDMN